MAINHSFKSWLSYHHSFKINQYYYYRRTHLNDNFHLLNILIFLCYCLNATQSYNFCIIYLIIYSSCFICCSVCSVDSLALFFVIFYLKNLTKPYRFLSAIKSYFIYNSLYYKSYLSFLKLIFVSNFIVLKCNLDYQIFLSFQFTIIMLSIIFI